MGVAIVVFMSSSQVELKPVDSGRLAAILDDLRVPWGLSADGQVFYLQAPNCVLELRYIVPEKDASFWGLRGTWPRRVNMAYISLAKNAMQHLTSTRFAPRVYFAAQDDGFLYFRSLWRFSWDLAGASDAQLREELRMALPATASLFRDLAHFFPDSWASAAEGQDSV